MKTYAPKGLWGGELRSLMAELFATQADICKYLQVSERTLRRWLSDDSAPYAVLAALWHETPRGRESAALDVGNEVVIQRGLASAYGSALTKETERLARVIAISQTGAANDPLITGPWAAQPDIANVPSAARAPLAPQYQPELPHTRPPLAL